MCNNKLHYNPELLKAILSTQNHHLIFNVGTPMTHKCGKSKLISHMFSLKNKSHLGSHFSNVLNFYTQFAFGMKDKAILADFNGFINDCSSQELQERLRSIG